MKAPKIYSIYNRPTSFAKHDFPDGLTEQHHAESCDINVIVARAMLDPESLTPEQPPQYLDLSNYPDFETMQNHVAEAHSLFEDLPADVRFKFNNKPSELLKFMSDPVNANEAIELGLFEPSEPTKSDTSDTKPASTPPENLKPQDKPSTTPAKEAAAPAATQLPT